MTNTGTLHHNHNHRGTWNNKADFILALISYGVGLGNVWRLVYFLGFFIIILFTY